MYHNAPLYHKCWYRKISLPNWIPRILDGLDSILLCIHVSTLWSPNFLQYCKLCGKSMSLNMEVPTTILSQASVHGHSQLKHQKLGVGSYTEDVLEWFNYPHASTHPRCEVSCQGVSNRPVSSPMLRWSQPDGGENCIVLESAPTHSLIANLLKHSSLVVCEFRTAGEERCKQGCTWLCAKPWCRMSWRLKHIRIIAATYVSSVDLLSIHYARI